MEVDVLTDSISTMKLMEPPKISHKEICAFVNKVKFDIQNAEELMRTPEYEKDRSHYYFETTQIRLLEEKLRILEKNERNNAFGEYSKTTEFESLKISALTSLARLSKESTSLKEKLGIAGQVQLHVETSRPRTIMLNMTPSKSCVRRNAIMKKHDKKDNNIKAIMIRNAAKSMYLENLENAFVACQHQ